MQFITRGKECITLAKGKPYGTEQNLTLWELSPFGAIFNPKALHRDPHTTDFFNSKDEMKAYGGKWKPMKENEWSKWMKMKENEN